MNPELFSASWFSALASIIVIDLILAGDNAIVIGWTAAKMIVSEPLLTDTLAGQRAIKVAIYAVIVGGLVAAPVMRMLRPSHRRQVATLAVVAAWLTVFGWIDDRLAEGVAPGEWVWDESIVDFVRWIGWIPVVVAMQRAFAPRANARAPAR